MLTIVLLQISRSDSSLSSCRQFAAKAMARGRATQNKALEFEESTCEAVVKPGRCGRLSRLAVYKYIYKSKRSLVHLLRRGSIASRGLFPYLPMQS